jgi:hypothetical protein
MNLNNQIFIDPSRFVPHYIVNNVTCINCDKLYSPAKDIEIKELLGISYICANNFCSRKCFDDFSKQLDVKNI